VLSLNSYKTGYASMREIVDHFFPPVGLLVPAGGENYTDFNYWRDKPLDIEDFTDSEDDDNDEDTEAGSIRSEDEGSEIGEDLEASYLTQDSRDDPFGDREAVESIEGEDGEMYVDDEDADDDEELDGEVEEGVTPTTQVVELDPIAERLGELGVRDATPTPRGSPRK
jgi:phosphatidate phosphatase LPIN